MGFKNWTAELQLNEQKMLFKDESLNEGGNVRAINRETGETVAQAEKIDLKKFKRKTLQKEFLNAFTILDKKFKKAFGLPLWPDFDQVKSGYAFNGSADAFFKDSISDEDFVQAKPKMGDIDVVIPHDNLNNLFNMLGTLEGQDITKNVNYLGQGKLTMGGHQINGVFKYTEGDAEGFFQVDFEGSDFDAKGKPSEWAKFGHSSSWEDMQKGYKGVNHKFLLVNMARGLSLKPDVTIVTDGAAYEVAKKMETPKKYYEGGDLPKTKGGAAAKKAVTEVAFSVDLGARIKIAPMYYEDTKNPIVIGGKFAYMPIPTRDSNYEKDLSKLFSMFFHKEPKGNDVSNLWSFIGIIKLMGKYSTKAEIKETFKQLVNQSLFGPAAQGLERNNPELDFKIKWAMVEGFFSAFPYLQKQEEQILKLADVYAEKYKMT